VQLSVRGSFHGLGVAEDRIYLDHGLTGTNRQRPGLNQALAAVRAGDTLVVPKLERLARSVPDARAIGDSLVSRGVKLSLGGTIYDPADPMGKMFFNILATFAEFEVDLLRLRTREGMAIARAKGRLRGKQPKLSARQQAHLVQLHRDGNTRSSSWPSCSRSPGRRCTECSNAPAARSRTCQIATPHSAEASAPTSR
jgi:DNA invertase Pin-like site-specific DNA recombinase